MVVELELGTLVRLEQEQRKLISLEQELGRELRMLVSQELEGEPEQGRMEL